MENVLRSYEYQISFCIKIFKYMYTEPKFRRVKNTPSLMLKMCPVQIGKYCCHILILYMIRMFYIHTCVYAVQCATIIALEQFSSEFWSRKNAYSRVNTHLLFLLKTYHGEKKRETNQKRELRKNARFRRSIPYYGAG